MYNKKKLLKLNVKYTREFKIKMKETQHNNCFGKVKNSPYGKDLKNRTNSEHSTNSKCNSVRMSQKPTKKKNKIKYIIHTFSMTLCMDLVSYINYG